MCSIPRRSHNFLLFAPIEVNLMILIPKMPKSIPLRTRLRVQRQDIIIDRSWRFVVDMLVEFLAPETWHFGHAHGPICCNPDTVNYLFCSRECRFWGEAVEHS